MRNFVTPIFSSVSGLFHRLCANKLSTTARNYSTKVDAVTVDVLSNAATAGVVPHASEREQSSRENVATVPHSPVVRRRRLQIAAADVLPAATGTSERGDNKTHKRFRRTKEEIRLGLSREQAMAKRGVRAKVSVTEPAIIMPDGKRFRRTAKEIELGLSKEEAAIHRQRYCSEPPKLNLDKTAVEQLEATLSPKIQARARAVHRYRAAGGKAVLTPDTLDQIEQFIASGKVTKCPTGMDSDGYDHFNQVDTTAKKEAA
ncbi:hypothetical protein ABIE88_003508 [Bradyrhizobium diazoefficiens]|uniref:hypothetical protein n=1 Tax=Bradyrhizobium diazoefficiens TaxID=1355477 RepID=UPI003511BAD1